MFKNIALLIKISIFYGFTFNIIAVLSLLKMNSILESQAKILNKKILKNIQLHGKDNLQWMLIIVCISFKCSELKLFAYLFFDNAAYYLLIFYFICVDFQFCF